MKAHRQLHLKARVAGVSRPGLSRRIEAEDRLRTPWRPRRLWYCSSSPGAVWRAGSAGTSRRRPHSRLIRLRTLNTSNWRSIIRGARCQRLSQRSDRRARPRLAAAVAGHDLPALAPQARRTCNEILERASLGALASCPRGRRRVGTRRVAAEFDLQRVERVPRNVDRIVHVGAVGVQISASADAVRRVCERPARLADVVQRQLGARRSPRRRRNCRRR